MLGTFGRASVPQRLLNQSLYQEMLLLQKFNDISGKVLKPKKISLQPQKTAHVRMSVDLKKKRSKYHDRKFSTISIKKWALFLHTLNVILIALCLEFSNFINKL